VEKWAYLRSYGNLNDILFLCTFWCYFGCDYFLGSTEEDHEHYEVTRILMSVLIITGFGKLMSLNRINSNISFIVQMILKVFVSIVPFLTLFMSLTFFMCCPQSHRHRNASKEEQCSRSENKVENQW